MSTVLNAANEVAVAAFLSAKSALAKFTVLLRRRCKAMRQRALKKSMKSWK